MCVGFENPNGQKVLVVANPYKTEKAIELEGKAYTLPAESINTIVVD